MKFSLRVLRARHTLREGTLGLPTPPPQLDALELFNSQDFDDIWHDARAPEVVRYLKGNRQLAIPDEWRPLLPQEL